MEENAIMFGDAAGNDVRRRDFYLKKAESILYHMSQYRESHFVPDPNKDVTINLAAGDNYPSSEVELFNEPEPDIYIYSKQKSKYIGTSPPPLKKNPHLLITVLFPISLTISLIAILFVKADIIPNIISLCK